MGKKADKAGGINAYEMFHKGIKVTSEAEYIQALEEYFENCRQAGELPCYTGIMLTLGLPNKMELSRLRQRNETVNAACNVIEYSYERAITTLRNPTGAIFALRAFGWTDRPTETAQADARTAILIATQTALLSAIRDGKMNNGSLNKSLQQPATDAIPDAKKALESAPLERVALLEATLELPEANDPTPTPSFFS